MKRILFLCTHNSCRSQMAEAILRHHFGDRYEVYSAGVEATKVSEKAISALKEKGFETAGLESNPIDEFLKMKIDEVVTVCDHAKEACPFFPDAKKYTHQSFVDPPEMVKEGKSPVEAFSIVRDQIEEWILKHFSK